MANSHIDALNTGAFLVDDSVDRYRRLAGLAITDDEFALATADRYHRVDRFKTSLHWLRHRLAGDNARRDFLYGRAGGTFNGTLTVDGVAQRIHHPAQQTLAYWHFKNTASTLDCVTLNNVLVGTQNHCADRILLEVQR